MNRKEEIIEILLDSSKALTVNQIHEGLSLELKGNKGATRKALHDLVKDSVVSRFKKKDKMLVFGIGIESVDFSKVPSPRLKSWGVQGV